MTADPSVETWRETLDESTSARLRRTEAELGSALRRLAELGEQLAEMRTRLRFALHDAEHLAAERDEALRRVAELEARDA